MSGLRDAHEGRVAFRLCDGTVSTTWTSDAVALVALCRCESYGPDAASGTWLGRRDHPLNESGASAAFDDWQDDHLAPLLAGIR